MPVVIAKLKLQSVIISIDLINRKKFDNTNNMMLTFKQNYKLLCIFLICKIFDFTRYN